MNYRTDPLRINMLASPAENQIDIKCFRGDQLNVPVELYEDDDVADLSNVSSITMLVKVDEFATAAIMSQTASGGDFENNRFTYSFTSVECNLSEASQDANSFYCVIWADKNNGEKATLAKGQLLMYWDGDPTNIGPAPTPPDFNLTSDEANARYVRFDTSQSLTSGEKSQARTNIGAGTLSSVTEADLSFSDITTANSSTLKHGLLPKLSGNSAQVLKGDGTWGAGGGGSGDVVGPASAVDGHIVQFDGTTGKLIKDGLATSGGGNGASDSGKVVTFGSGGHLFATDHITVENGGGHGGSLFMRGSDGLNTVRFRPNALTGIRIQVPQDQSGTVALAWSINVKDAPYRATGDARKVTDAVLNGTTTVTSATAAFTNADNDKTVWGVETSTGLLRLPLGTATYVNATTITTSVAATGFYTGIHLVIGTDDTASIQAAAAAADAMSPKGHVYLPSGGYVFSDTLFIQSYASGTDSYGISGDGNVSTKFFPTPSHAKTGGYLFNTASNANHTMMRGFTIDGSSYQYTGSPSCVQCNNGFTMEDVAVVNLKGVTYGVNIIGSAVLMHDCHVEAISYIGIHVVGGLVELSSTYAGNCGYLGLLFDTAVDGKMFGGVIDECGSESVYLQGATGILIDGSLVYAADGQAAVHVDATSTITIVGSHILPFNTNNNCTGLKVISGGSATISSTKLESSGTGYAINNAGTVTDGGGNSIENLTGTALTSGIYANIPVSVLNSGTGATSSTFWRGDGTWAAAGAGTVTSVSFTGGLISVATATTTPALTVAGTSGGIPYFSSGTTWASSAALAANALVVGGGAGAAPSTITTGTGVVTALGVNTGSAGAFVINGGALGTPSSGTVTNLTGTASININGTVGATTPTTGAFTTLANSGLQTSTGGSNSATPTNLHLITNTTAATVGVQSASPSVIWTGAGWKTTATAASQPVSYRAYVLPVQGTTAPSATWVLGSDINATGTYTNRLAINSDDGITVTSAGSGGTVGTLTSAYGSCTMGIGGTGLRLSSLVSTGSGSFQIDSGGGNPTILYTDGTDIIQMGADAATPTAQGFKGADGSGTDKTGSQLNIGGGKGTGTGRGGDVVVKTTNASTTGSTAQSYSTRRYDSAKFVDLTESTATLFCNIAVASAKYAGARLICTITANDGTDYQSLTSQITVDAVNKAGTVTATLTQVDNTTAASAGTLTCTYTAVANGNTVDIKANAVSSLTQTVLRAKWSLISLNTDGADTSINSGSLVTPS